MDCVTIITLQWDIGHQLRNGMHSFYVLEYSSRMEVKLKILSTLVSHLLVSGVRQLEIWETGLKNFMERMPLVVYTFSEPVILVVFVFQTAEIQLI